MPRRWENDSPGRDVNTAIWNKFPVGYRATGSRGEPPAWYFQTRDGAVYASDNPYWIDDRLATGWSLSALSQSQLQSQPPRQERQRSQTRRQKARQPKREPEAHTRECSPGDEDDEEWSRDQLRPAGESDKPSRLCRCNEMHRMYVEAGYGKTDVRKLCPLHRDAPTGWIGIRLHGQSRRGEDQGLGRVSLMEALENGMAGCKQVAHDAKDWWRQVHSATREYVHKPGRARRGEFDMGTRIVGADGKPAQRVPLLAHVQRVHGWG